MLLLNEFICLIKPTASEPLLKHSALLDWDTFGQHPQTK